MRCRLRDDSSIARGRFFSSRNDLKTSARKETGGYSRPPELFISAETQKKAALPRPAGVVASIAGACWSFRQTSSAGQDSKPPESVRSTTCEFPSSWRGDPVVPLNYPSADFPSAIVLTSECRPLLMVDPHSSSEAWQAFRHASRDQSGPDHVPAAVRPERPADRDCCFLAPPPPKSPYREGRQASARA